MYNHYQNYGNYVPIEPEQSTQTFSSPKADVRKTSAPLGEISSGITTLLSGTFKHLKLEDFDAGDILLVLIILFLFLEGDNLELVITLGLMLLLGLGED